MREHTHGLASWDHNHGGDNYHDHPPEDIPMPCIFCDNQPHDKRAQHFERNPGEQDA